jgi:hypothetical protein
MRNVNEYVPGLLPGLSLEISAEYPPEPGLPGLFFTPGSVYRLSSSLWDSPTILCKLIRQNLLVFLLKFLIPAKKPAAHFYGR